MKKQIFIEIITIFIFSLIPLFWFSGNEMVLGHDSGFRLVPWDHLKNLFYTRGTTINFGEDWSLYKAFLIIQFPETIFTIITNSVIWGQRISFIFWFLIIGLSMHIFIRYIFPEKKYQPLHIFAPIFYMFNFYILSAWAIAERAKFSLYIALPLMIVIFMKAITNEFSSIKGAIFFGLLFFVFNGGGSPPLFGSVLLTFLLLLFYFLFHKKRNIKRIFAFVFMCFICFSTFNAFWILPQYGLLADGYTNAVASKGGIEGLIAWEKEISKYASFANLLRLQGFPDWYNNPDHQFSNTYINNFIFIIGSIIPFFVIGIGLLIFKLNNNSQKILNILRILLLMVCLGLFFTAGSHPPFGFVYIYLMRYLPGFAVFRSSFYKFAPSLYFPIIILFGYYLCEFFRVLKLKPKVIFIISLILPIVVVLYHFPFLTGNFFNLKGGFSTRVSVPFYVTNMANELNNYTAPNDRILLLPPMDNGYIGSPIDTYKWGFYSLDVLPRIIINRPFISNDSNDDSITWLIYKSIWDSDSVTFLHLVETTGIKYILWRNDIRYSLGTENEKSISTWKRKLINLQSIQKIKTEGEWDLYKILNKTKPLIYTPEVVSSIETPSPFDAYIVSRPEVKDNEILLRVTSKDVEIKKLFVEKEFIEWECFLCATNEFDKLVKSISLPAIRKYPISKLNDWQINKEQNSIFTAITLGQQIDARLSVLSRTIARYSLGQNINSLTINTQTNEILNALKSLNGREKDVYANRIYAYFESFRLHTNNQQNLHEINQNIKKVLENVRLLTWMYDNKKIYRFGLNVPRDGKYKIYLPDNFQYQEFFNIDGNLYKINDYIPLNRGYHRLELIVKASNTINTEKPSVFLFVQNEEKNIKIPFITFKEINPSNYEVYVKNATESFILVFNQRYDKKWVFAIDGVKQNIKHFEVNGFANAWVVPKNGEYTITLYYLPQQYFKIGMIISIVSVFIAFIYLVLQHRNSRLV